MVVGLGGAAFAPELVEGAVAVVPPERAPAEDCAIPALPPPPPMLPPPPPPPPPATPPPLPTSGAVEALGVPENLDAGASRLLDCALVDGARTEPATFFGVHFGRQVVAAGQVSP
jgi:hypothetical protein